MRAWVCQPGGAANMSDFLHKLQSELVGAKDRFAAAQKKYAAAQVEQQTATQRLQVAQVEFQTAAQEMSSYQTLVNLWTKKEQEQATAPSPAMSDRLAIEVRGEIIESPAGNSANAEANKTEKVRDLLRQ